MLSIRSLDQAVHSLNRSPAGSLREGLWPLMHQTLHCRKSAGPGISIFQTLNPRIKNNE